MMAAQIAFKVPAGERSSQRRRYQPPVSCFDFSLSEVLGQTGREALEARRFDLFNGGQAKTKDLTIFGAGDLELLSSKSVAIVGTRQVSEAGYRRARKLARELVADGIVVVSGLAKGVDTAAHTGAIDALGRTIAVIGTPLEKAYPAENAALQETIWRDHLLLSPFEPGSFVNKGNFPKRNRVMAAITDATVIIEASDTSGTLHQAAECLALGKWLFIARSVLEDSSLTWPSRFLGKPKVGVLAETKDIISAIVG